MKQIISHLWQETARLGVSSGRAGDRTLKGTWSLADGIGRWKLWQSGWK